MSSRCRILRAVSWLVCLTAATAQAAPDSLWSLVRKDVGLAVELRDWQTHRHTLAKSPLAERLQTHPLWKSLLGGSDWKKLIELEVIAQSLTGSGLVDLTDAWLGQQAVLALYPQSAEVSEAVLLLRLASSAEGDRLRTAWEKLDRRESVLTKRGSDSYYISRRVTGQDPAPPLYFAALNDTLVISDSLQMLELVFDLRAQQGPGSLTELRGFTRWNEMLSEALPLRLYLQPDAWKFLGTEVYDETSKDPLQHLLLRGWVRCEAIGVGLQWEPDLLVKAFAYFPEAVDSPGWQQFAKRMAGPPQLVERTPANALLMVAARHDLPGAWQAVQPEMARMKGQGFHGGRQLLRGLLQGYDPLTDVLAHLPADYGLCVLADTAPSATTPIPLTAIFALQIPADEQVPAKGNITLRNALQNALHTALGYLSAMEAGPDGEMLEVQSAPLAESTDFESLSGLPYVQPGYGFSGNWLLFASHPHSAQHWHLLRPDLSMAQAAWYQTLSQRYFPRAGQVLIWNVQELRQFGTQHKSRLSSTLQTWHGLTPEAADRTLERIGDWLKLTDLVFAAVTVGDDTIEFVMGTQVSAAPKTP